MQSYRFTLAPLTAFGTPLAGDTLFGQLCWTLRHQLGNERLVQLLQGYTAGNPFAVVSDAMPSGHIPLPLVPSRWWQQGPGDSVANRKTLKKKRWLPLDALTAAFPLWQSLARSDAEVALALGCVQAGIRLRAQPHNTINRQTGTTGEEAFAPYTLPQIWFDQAMRLDIRVVLDETRLSLAELTAAIDAIGSTGYGRDASIGLGKFRRTAEPAVVVDPPAAAANSYLTLGPCAPQGQGFCPQRSTYQMLTRFGRHGDLAVQSGNPFKRPVLMARGASVFWPQTVEAGLRFIGQGLGGASQPVSSTMPETVHQGYAPVIAIRCPEEALA